MRDEERKEVKAKDQIGKWSTTASNHVPGSASSTWMKLEMEKFNFLQAYGNLGAWYQLTIQPEGTHHIILHAMTVIAEYKHESFEELHLEDYSIKKMAYKIVIKMIFVTFLK